jgi:hypothetical protein
LITSALIAILFDDRKERRRHTSYTAKATKSMFVTKSQQPDAPSSPTTPQSTSTASAAGTTATSSSSSTSTADASTTSCTHEFTSFLISRPFILFSLFVRSIDRTNIAATIPLLLKSFSPRTSASTRNSSPGIDIVAVLDARVGCAFVDRADRLRNRCCCCCCRRRRRRRLVQAVTATSSLPSATLSAFIVNRQSSLLYLTTNRSSSLILSLLLLLIFLLSESFLSTSRYPADSLISRNFTPPITAGGGTTSPPATSPRDEPTADDSKPAPTRDASGDGGREGLRYCESLLCGLLFDISFVWSCSSCHKSGRGRRRTATGSYDIVFLLFSLRNFRFVRIHSYSLMHEEDDGGG